MTFEKKENKEGMAKRPLTLEKVPPTDTSDNH